jgi:hypothetical protein
MNLDLTHNIDKDKFLKSKDWQAEFNSLTNTERKIAIILSILECPYRTCRSNKVFQKVLHFLGVRTSQRPKELFRRQINNNLRQLTKNRVIKEYNKNKKYPRVKYNNNPTNNELLNTLLRKYYGTQDSQDANFGNVKNDYTQIHPGTVDHSEVNFDNESEVTKSAEKNKPEKNEKFNIFDVPAEDDKGIVEMDNSNEKSVETPLDQYIDFDDIPDLESENNNKEKLLRVNDIPDINILKQTILSYYSEIPDIIIEEPYPDIKLILEDQAIDCSIIIDIDASQKLVILKGYVKFYDKAVIDILKYWPNNEFIAAIGIEEHVGKEKFVIKQRVDLISFNQQEITSLIDNIIRAVKSICAIIEQHL